MSGPRVAVVGVTGAVGQELLDVLAVRSFPVGELVPMASARSAGGSVTFGGRDFAIVEAGPDAFAGVDYALFSAGGDISRALAPAAVEAGAIVVDNSSAFRLDDGVPLVVPECNPEAIDGHRGILANPNCSTILLTVALGPLHREAGVRRVIASTYQAASGAGARAVEELRDTTRAALAGEPVEPSVLPHSLAFNLFARIDRFEPGDYTREEDKMLFETRKILSLPELDVEATCVRVPVERCHAESITVELERELSPEAARGVFHAAPGVVVEDDPAEDLHPQPRFRAGQDDVAVGRIRRSRAFDPGLAFWLVGDQVRKGAALNAVQILELVHRRTS